MKKLFQIALLMGAACLLSNQSFAANESELAAYVSIFSMAQEAEKNCPNTYASDAAILILKEANHVTEKDDRALKAETNKSRAAIQRQIAEDGATKWCKTTLERYGPKGSVQKILITR
jgi:hypothetical protein